MAVINRVAEVEVVRVDVANAGVALLIGLAVIAHHDSLDISRSVTVVSDVGSHLGTIHSLQPRSPVALSSGRNAGSIASAPSIVVGTQDGVLTVSTQAQVALDEADDEVVPVVGTAAVVGEGADECLARSYLDQVRECRPPTCRVVGITDAGVHLVDHLELCRSDDGRAVLALVGLVVDSHEGLRAERVQVGHSLEGEVLSGDGLRHALLELHLSRDVSGDGSQVGALQNLARSTLQLHRQRQLVLSRCASADWLHVGGQEVDVGTLGHQECTDGRVRSVGIQVGQRSLLCVLLHDGSIGDLHDESAIRAVDGQHYASAELLNAGIGIGLEGKRAYHERTVDVVAPLGVAAGLVVEANSTIFLIVGSTAVLVVAEDECEVLIGVGGVGVDVQVEQSVPDTTLINLIVLGELSPPTRAEVGSTDGVDVFHHAFQFLVIATLVSIDRVDHLLEPVGGVYAVEIATLAAGHRQHSQCCCAEGHC